MTKTLPASRIRELVEAKPDELIRIYTYQDVGAWEVAQQRGYFTGNHDHAYDGIYDHPYEWMRARMAEVIPDFSGDLPMWAWSKRSSNKKRHKDRYMRITALVPRKRILPSCYDLWHHPLNNWQICRSKEEDEEFDTAYPRYLEPGSDPVYQEIVESNWREVFNLSPRTGYMLENYGTLNRVQLCVDRIYLPEIQSIRPPQKP